MVQRHAHADPLLVVHAAGVGHMAQHIRQLVVRYVHPLLVYLRPVPVGAQQQGDQRGGGGFNVKRCAEYGLVPPTAAVQ